MARELGRFGLIDIVQDAGSKLITIGATAENTGEILMRDSGLKAQLKKVERSLSMLETPVAEWKKYTDELTALSLIHGAAVNEDYKMLSEAGYSDDIAQHAAKTKNARALMDSKALLEVKYPYANDYDTMAGATAKLGHAVHIPGMKSSAAQGVVEQQKKRRRKAKGKQ